MQLAFRQPEPVALMDLAQFVQRSRATPAFRAAVEQFRLDGEPNERVAFTLFSPPLKVERLLTRLLESLPELAIEAVRIQAASGCEYYRGMAQVRTADGEYRVEFHWDCRWRAQQQGWRDCFGFPDQGRAARVFGHDCFRRWEVAEVPVVATP